MIVPRLASAGVALVLLLAPKGIPALSISEVLYDADGSDGGKVFVELFGVPGTSLEGLTLEGVNGTDGAIGPSLVLTGLVPADGYFVVADHESGQSEVADADLLLDFDLQNGPDSLVLRALDGSVIDALGYGVFGPGEVFAGEGTPAPDVPSGQSLARRLPDLDTDDNALDFVAATLPTPGHGPTLVPEPSLALLLALAGIGLGLARGHYP